MIIFIYVCYRCNKLNDNKLLGIATVEQVYTDNNGKHMAVYEYQTKTGALLANQHTDIRRLIKTGKYYLVYNNNNTSVLLIDFPVEKQIIPDLDNIKVDCFCNVSYLK